MNTAFRPSNTEDESEVCGPRSIFSDTSPSRTSASPWVAITIWLKAFGLSSEVSASTLIWVKSLFTSPAAVVKLLASSAARTSFGVTPCAAMRVGSSQMRMENSWPPRIWALATPSTVCSRGWMTRVR